MKLLAIDTATSMCSVALIADKRQFMVREQVAGKHSSVLFRQLKHLLDEASLSAGDLDGVIYAAGPGSYTGLRVGGSAIKGLLFPLQDIRFYAASTLAGYAACALQAGQPITLHALIDARRQHAYYQQFYFDGVRLSPLKETEIKPLAEIASLIQEGDMLTGTGLDRLDSACRDRARLFPETELSAGGLLKLVSIDPDQQFYREADIRQFEPDYHSGNTWNHAR